MVYCNIVIWDPNIASRVRKTETSKSTRRIKQAKLYLAGLHQCYILLMSIWISYPPTHEPTPRRLKPW